MAEASFSAYPSAGPVGHPGGDTFLDHAHSLENPERGGAGTVSTALSLAGAVLSLALIVGLVFWGYNLLARDVTGIPVVEALDGPTRVAPEDPGGRAAAHQGLAVSDVAEQGAMEAPVDQVVLAPQPEAVADEDLPMASLAPEEQAELAQIEAAPVYLTDDPSTADDTVAGAVVADAAPVPTPLTEDGEIDILALADQLAAVAVTTFSEAEPTVEAAVADADVVEAAPAGLTRSARPVARVIRTVAQVPAVVPASASDAPIATDITPVAATIDIDPAAVPAGTRLVQLGAFDSAEIATSEWDRLMARFGPYLEGKQRLIQQATSGGRSFYRLRAVGFVDLADARRLCSTLVAEGAACIPVVTK